MSKTMDPLATDKARKAEQKGLEKSGAGLFKINPIAIPSAGSAGGSGSGFKKGGFKSAFGKVDDGDAQTETQIMVADQGGLKAQEIKNNGMEVDESDTDDEGYERYSPSRPTGCAASCRARGR